MQEIVQYAHVLLFACPECERPLIAVCVSANKNLEAAEASWFSAKCHCGWTGDVSGVTATKHWVQPWRGKWLKPSEPGSCNGDTLWTESKIDV